ncbi:membrane protein [Microbacterium phage Araxxi]|uniref:Membrane protein n=1 Tax=Microbacterium phage Araxxi TaxID=2590948 RepID=A0A516KT53_9CAUD|nr:membrane protein [Microbacterium phage Araxxi]QDP44843.1 membrane protein [Microbacterium phage Araxxi]
MTTTSKINTAFGMGMLTGGIIVILMFMFLVVAGDKAAADDTVRCDQYVAPAICNTENPPHLFTPAPEKAPNCVEKEEIGHCSELLAQTGQGNNLHLVATGLIIVALGSIITISVIWMRHAASKREGSDA